MATGEGILINSISAEPQTQPVLWLMPISYYEQQKQKQTTWNVRIIIIIIIFLQLLT